jgi:hypothetical protein
MTNHRVERNLLLYNGKNCCTEIEIALINVAELMLDSFSNDDALELLSRLRRLCSRGIFSLQMRKGEFESWILQGSSHFSFIATY